MGVYWDNSSKGVDPKRLKERRHSCWRAEVIINRKRHRKRFHSYSDAWLWVDNIKKITKRGHSPK